MSQHIIEALIKRVNSFCHFSDWYESSVPLPQCRPSVPGSGKIKANLSVQLLNASCVLTETVVVFQDTDEFILPTGANKTRGRFELAFFTIGGSCMTGKRTSASDTTSIAQQNPKLYLHHRLISATPKHWPNYYF